MCGLAADGKVRLPERIPSQPHCSTIGTRLSHLGMRSINACRRAGAAGDNGTVEVRSSFITHDLVVDRLVAEVVRLPRRTGSQADDQIHLRLEHDVVAGVTDRKSTRLNSSP